MLIQVAPLKDKSRICKMQMERLKSSGFPFSLNLKIYILIADFPETTRFLFAYALDGINERREKHMLKCLGATITKEEITVY